MSINIDSNFDDNPKQNLPEYTPKLFKLTHDKYGTIHILGSNHSYGFEKEISEELISLLNTTQVLFVEVTAITDKKTMDDQIASYILEHTTSRIVPLESIQEQMDAGEYHKNTINYDLTWKKKLIYERNLLMKERLLKKLEFFNYNKSFVVVGLGHLELSEPGCQSLLDLLKEIGFTCKEINFDVGGILKTNECFEKEHNLAPKI